MNNAVETAQETTGKVTAGALLAHLKGNIDRLSLWARIPYNRASYSDAAVFEVKVTRKDSKSGAESRSDLPVPGWIGNGHTSERELHPSVTPDGSAWWRYTHTFRPDWGHWYLGCSADKLTDILELLPSDAEVAFSVALDHGTNELLVAADCKLSHYSEQGLHGDFLYLNVQYTKRGKTKRAQFLIDTQVSAHNSARFGVR